MEENEEMRWLLAYTLAYFCGEEGCKACPLYSECESLPNCKYPDYFREQAQKFV